MQIESQKKMSSVKAAPEASSSRNVIRAGASKLQIKRTTATQVPSAASSRLSSQTKSHVTSAVEEEKETYVELPDIDSEYVWLSVSATCGLTLSADTLIPTKRLKQLKLQRYPIGLARRNCDKLWQPNRNLTQISSLALFLLSAWKVRLVYMEAHLAITHSI